MNSLGFNVIAGIKDSPFVPKIKNMNDTYRYCFAITQMQNNINKMRYITLTIVSMFINKPLNIY